jgi:hypothetical protein
MASSCHGDASLYLSVFRFPSVAFPYSGSSEFGKDGYFARVLGDHTSHKISNALSGVQPEAILLLGLTEVEQGYLRAILPNDRLTAVDQIGGVLEHLPLGQTVEGFVACKGTQIIEGLLLAKFAHKRLTIDESAPSLPSSHLHGGEGLVVIENDGSINDVAAVNYAFSIGADVALVSPVGEQVVSSVPRRLAEWRKDHSHNGYQEVKRLVRNRLRGIEFQRYKSVTFFTRGLPYGLFINNATPCSHVLKELDCGVFIVDSLVDAHAPTVFDSAIVFSPERFASEESSAIITTLSDCNYTVTPLLGKDATVRNLSNYGGFFPFDLMHICTHGGETDGYFVVQKFVDRQGATHEFEFYEVVGFGPVEGDRVQVTRKAIFKSFDGFPWKSEPLEAYPAYVFEDMMKAIKSDKDDGVIRVRYDSPISLSCHIQCHDSIHQGEFQSLGGFGHPVVFNNSCSSSHELEAQFIHAGARAYVGTLWSMGNETATEAAVTFYKEIVTSGNLLAALVAMNGSIRNPDYLNIYILWGLHFSSLHKPSGKSDRKIFEALIASYFMWMKKIATTPDPEARRNSIPIAKFLLETILERFSTERLTKVGDFDSDAIENYERALPTPERSLVRGLFEVETPL